MFRRELKIGSATLSLETGKLAKQSDGAVIIRQGDTMVWSPRAVPRARAKASTSCPSRGLPRIRLRLGTHPGGFFKREGKPADKETLTCRLIDRPIRPLFPAGWYYETQIIGMLIRPTPRTTRTCWRSPARPPRSPSRQSRSNRRLPPCAWAWWTDSSSSTRLPAAQDEQD